MKREILFKGKGMDNDEWVQGYYFKRVRNYAGVKTVEYFYIMCETRDEAFIAYEVYPETVGQFTGLTDKNGKKIFEGDIVKSCCCLNDGKTMAVKFDTLRRGWFPFACGDGCGCCEVDTYSPEYIEIIGNVYDNPELLGEMK